MQEEAASALASLAFDVAHQKAILHAGAVPPLVTMLKMGSAAAQAFAAKALANAAAYDAELGQNAIASWGRLDGDTNSGLGGELRGPHNGSSSPMHSASDALIGACIVCGAGEPTIYTCMHAYTHCVWCR